jgi:hypothetical protein
MPMRQDCKNFESRTYAGGETVRKCNLDLAPEAPWRCPEHCAQYTRRLADVNWSHGSLITPPTPPEPPGLDEGDDRVSGVLDAAEDHLNEVGAQIMADFYAEQQARQSQGWRRFLPRRKK